MMEIGKIQKLKVIKEKDFGIYLSDGDKADAQGVLLPKKQVPAGTKIGDEIVIRSAREGKSYLVSLCNPDGDVFANIELKEM